jgi:hypothetical protein
MAIAEIESKTEITTVVQQYNYIRCSILELNLNKSVKILTDFLTGSGCIVMSQIDKLEGDDYSAWGNDDKYIIDWICRKYNLNIK